ncbi:HAD family hydrolase [Methylomagnum sp.]
MGNVPAKLSQVVAIFDLDGTITRNDTYVGFLLSVLRSYPSRGVRASWLPLAVLMYKLKWRNNTWLKCQFLAAICGGFHPTQLDPIVARFIAEVAAKDIRPGARAAIAYHREQGHRLVLASASFDFYVRPLAHSLGIKEIVCTEAEWTNGLLTATLKHGNCYGEQKLNLVKALIGGARSTAYLYGYSDHHTDIPLLDWVDEGVAVNPGPLLISISRSKGYQIADWEM